MRDTDHITLLFVDKGYHKKGVATSLFKYLLDYLKPFSVSEISVNSSIYAYLVYSKLSFIQLDTIQEVNGIKFIPMKYIVKATDGC